MLADILTMIWKEWKELLLSRGGIRGGLVSTVGIPMGMLGVYLPWQNGPEWVTTPLLPVAWSWLPLLLVGALVADSFAGERERKTLETLLASRLSDRAILLGKIAALVGYGWGLALSSLVLGTFTVNLLHGKHGLLLPGANTVVVIAVFGLLTSLLAASGGVLISLRATSVRQAAQINSLVLMALVLGAVALGKALPPGWHARIAFAPPNLVRTEAMLAAALLVADAALLAAAAMRFQRARLILD
ncbi:MAG: ABC transporter permease [Bryobacteraceae bacterium]